MDIGDRIIIIDGELTGKTGRIIYRSTFTDHNQQSNGVTGPDVAGPDVPFIVEAEDGTIFPVFECQLKPAEQDINR
jgi:hypothetical protein